MPYVTTVLYSYVSGEGWEAKTTLTYLYPVTYSSPYSSRQMSSFATSIYSSSLPTPTETDIPNTTPAPRFPRPTTTPKPLPANSQPTHFPTGVVIGVCAAILILLILLLSVLAWKGKLRKLNPYQNPYVRKMKREAQDERVRQTEREKAEKNVGGLGIVVPKKEKKGRAVMPPEAAVDNLPELARGKR